MAVDKMKKLTIVADNEKEETVFQILQGLQAVEIQKVSEEVLTRLGGEETFQPETVSKLNVKNYESILGKIQESLLIIERYAALSHQKSQLRRSVYTLADLEEQYDPVAVEGYVETILSLKEKLDMIGEERERLSVEENLLARWKNLTVLPKDYEDMTYTELILGSLNLTNQADFLSEIEKLERVHCEEIYLSPHHGYYALLVLKNEKNLVQQIISNYSFQRYFYPYEVLPEQAYQETKEKVKQLIAEEKAVKKEIGHCYEWKKSLYLAEEVVRAKIQREVTKKGLARSQDFFVLQGWIPESEEEDLSKELNRRFPDNDVYLLFEEPTAQEIQQVVPTKLKNHPVVEPFEMLTEMYSLPRYDEIDPTPIMMPFYLTFFGMMAADIGYGLLLFLATTLVRKFVVLPKGRNRFMKLFQILSLPIMAWGFIYGSFFGVEIYQYIGTGGLPLPLLSTTTDVNQILILSVVFGFIQIMTGLLVNGIQLIKRKQYLSSVSESFAWQGLLVGIIVLASGMLFLDNQGFVIIGSAVAILSALSIVVVPIIQSKSKLKGLAKGMYGLYGITGYIGDLVSYTRLMALGISGGSIAAAFNMIVGFMPPVAKFSIGIVLLIVLHGLNIFLSLLSAYVHGARLQYVEFFGKFYTGGGRAFNPLKTEEKYINIEKKK
ncbi:V-type ATP synthase subunit I [Vagococcus elongatus]|uniref:V-type ATP synthase subunit I n=1 Tax=Vagococcus elongatus TaxID=180344 RepID=A0A430AR54_9ENTE|nr:V-type ATP synthase subunit I [Vagococcus elongatus]RSU10546.1 V-type ATP synthase subunit I [Vagococcus elongatus]